MLISVEFLIYVFCLAGGTYTAYKIGHKAGIEGAVQYFIDQGILEVDDDE